MPKKTTKADLNAMLVAKMFYLFEEYKDQLKKIVLKPAKQNNKNKESIMQKHAKKGKFGKKEKIS